MTESRSGFRPMEFQGRHTNCGYGLTGGGRWGRLVTWHDWREQWFRASPTMSHSVGVGANSSFSRRPISGVGASERDGPLANPASRIASTSGSADAYAGQARPETEATKELAMALPEFKGKAMPAPDPMLHSCVERSCGRNR